MTPRSDITDTLLDMYGTLKDEVIELRESTRQVFQSNRGRHRSIAPGHTPDEPWAPCDQEEVSFYACFTHLH